MNARLSIYSQLEALCSQVLFLKVVSLVWKRKAIPKATSLTLPSLKMQDKFYLLLELKNQIWPKVWPKVWPKMSKIVAKAAFSSHVIGLQLRKMKMYSINFIRAYMGNHEKSTQSKDLLTISIIFSWRLIF